MSSEVAGDETEPELQVGIGEPVPAQPAVGGGSRRDFDTDQVLGALKDLQAPRVMAVWAAPRSPGSLMAETTSLKPVG